MPPADARARTATCRGRSLILAIKDDPCTSSILDAILKKRGHATRLAADLHEIKRALHTRQRRT